MGDRKATLTAVLVDAVSGTSKKIQAEINGIGSAVSKVNSVLTGIGQGIGQALYDGITRAVETVATAIPKLLDQGHAYLDQLRQIELETGMTAEQTSTLVGALRAMAVPTDDITTLMARLGSNLAQNEGQFRALGIATRDSKGNLLDAYTIFQNIRRAVQEHGASLLSTAAAQEVFGRSGYQLIAALQASDAEWQAATEDVRRWGGVVSQAAIDGADRLKKTLSSLGQGITDIGVNIAAAVDPYLRAFVDSFAKFVQAHLQQIVDFAVAVVNTITGFISGLFGITDTLDVSAGAVESSTTKAGAATDNFGKVLKGAAAGSDAFTTSINAQIKAIDAHIAAVEQAAQRRKAVQERQKLADSLAAAQAQLADLQGNAPFLGGLSAAEQALAVQKHAQDVIDAEKNVQDQRQAIGDFEADQKDRAETELLNREKQRLQDSLAAHKLANAQILQSGLQLGAGLDNSLGQSFTNLGLDAKAWGATAAASFKTGVDAAKSFLDVLLGTEEFHQTGAGGTGYTIRVGGVVGAIGAVGSAIGNLGTQFQHLSTGIDVLSTAASIFMGMTSRMFGILQDFLHFDFAGAQQDAAALRAFILSQTQGFVDRNRASGGWVGLNGPEIVRTGEEGPEYVIANHDLGKLGGPVINVHFDFLTAPTDVQLRDVTQKISRLMALEFSQSPVSALASGSF